MQPPKGTRGSSRAILRALAVLEALSRKKGGMTHAELTRRLKIPKSSATYILSTLLKTGYIKKDALSARYSLGLKLLSLSTGLLSGFDIREAALPHLGVLAKQTRLTAHLAVLEGKEAVYIEKAEAPTLIRVNTNAGKGVEAHASAVGKAIAAFLSSAEVEDLLEDYAFKRLTPKTIVSKERFLKELGLVRSRGYATDLEEVSEGVVCLAIPLFNSSQRVEAAIGLTGTSAQLTSSTIPHFAAALQDTAHKISRELLYQTTLKRR
jgi:DNA-binding IclR family transcriptional regulator